MSATARTVRTTMDPPALVGLPLEWPAIDPECGVCVALGGQRADAQAAGDPSRVTDCNVEIRNHQHGGPE